MDHKIRCHFKMFHQCSINLGLRKRLKIANLLIFKEIAGCSAVGSALRSGRRSRQFESGHPDRMS